MRRFGPLMVALGVSLLVLGLGLAGAPAALALTATASPTLPDRPTLTPVAPTATAEPAAPTEERRQPAAPGRITGTVIDLTTGAPAPGVPVAVGDDVVLSDGNGNYDRSGLAAESYVVELRLPAGRGEPAQGPITVALRAGETVVQHLAFRGPQPAAATPAAPAATPEAPAPTAGPVPTPAPTPATLPRTGGAEPQAALLLAGLALILAGAGVSFGGRQR
jgi:LPXTG-motif cell wall-anchored protein